MSSPCLQPQLCNTGGHTRNCSAAQTTSSNHLIANCNTFFADSIAKIHRGLLYAVSLIIHSLRCADIDNRTALALQPHSSDLYHTWPIYRNVCRIIRESSQEDFRTMSGKYVLFSFVIPTGGCLPQIDCTMLRVKGTLHFTSHVCRDTTFTSSSFYHIFSATSCTSHSSRAMK